MSKNNSVLEIVDQVVSYGVQQKILHLVNQDDNFTGNTIKLWGKQVVNFGSCSYLGLEFDPRLRNAAKRAIDNYGTQFSESRAYVSLKPYEELELLLGKIFDAHCIVTPTTTLGHIATIPVIVGLNDAIIMDHQVHNSIQMAVSMLKGKGVHIELLRHNRMDLLEEKIIELKKRHSKVWYMADGVYSMFGDTSPVDEIYVLLEKYKEFHYYVDDAHGMSIFGKNGKGYVLSNRIFHPKMVLAVSLSKAFAAGGGAMIFPEKDMARKVRTCGGPLITSGPMQPAVLGAAVASAQIHLSDEIDEMQEELRENIRFANLQLKKYRLPVVSQSDGAVFFIGVSLPKVGYNMVRRMLDRGYYVNLGIFPAVPMKNTGIRFTITRLHTFSQIESMIKAMAEELPIALTEEGITLKDIYAAFKLPIPEEEALNNMVNSIIKQSLSLKLDHYKNINEINREEWNDLFQDKGSFDWEGLQVLQKTFTGNSLQEDNWAFDYIIIKDHYNKVILASVLTTALWKDDMLSPEAVSLAIEKKRKEEPYYLTSRIVSAGSLLTEGEHLYLDRSSPLWKEAMKLFFDKVNALQENYEADGISIRDFHNPDNSFDDFMVENGFFKATMPDTNIIENINWTNPQELYNTLSKSSKEKFKKHVRRYEQKFTVEYIEHWSPEDVDKWYQLYENVRLHNLSLNTFALPKKLFLEIAKDNNWEILQLTLNEGSRPVVCVVFSYKGENSYVPMVIGLDYNYSHQFHVYRQALYQLALRCSILKKKKMFLGFSASIEKKKIGAKAIPTYSYMQLKDNYHFQVIEEMAGEAVLSKSFNNEIIPGRVLSV